MGIAQSLVSQSLLSRLTAIAKAERGVVSFDDLSEWPDPVLPPPLDRPDVVERAQDENGQRYAVFDIPLH